MYFIHYIQTYASVNRKGSELQEYILKFKDCLLKDRNTLDDLKEEIHCMGHITNCTLCSEGLLLAEMPINRAIERV